MNKLLILTHLKISLKFIINKRSIDITDYIAKIILTNIIRSP